MRCLGLQSRRLRALRRTFALLTIGTFASADEIPYAVPAAVTVDVSCPMPAEQLRTIELQFSRSEQSWPAMAVDLNGDGQCEVFADAPRSDEGNGYEYTMVLVRRDGEFIEVGDLVGAPDGWWFGPRQQGFLRIFVPMNGGHRTNPEFVTAVFAWDGQRYVNEAGRTATHGYYMDRGRAALQTGDLAAAETSYLNALRMNKVPALGDANNLAVVWLRMRKFEETRSLLSGLLTDSEPASIAAAAHYNLGRVEEELGRRDAALREYLRANELQPSAARQRKVAELQTRLRAAGSAN